MADLDDDQFLDDDEPQQSAEPDFDSAGFGLAPEPKPKRDIPWRKIATGAAVLILGGGLGTGVYYVQDMDSKDLVGDLIGLLDVADSQPKLSFMIPSRDEATKAEDPAQSAPTQPGSLLTPPGGARPVPMEPPPPIPGEALPAPNGPNGNGNGNGAKPAGPQVTLPGVSAPSVAPPTLPAASQVAELPPVPKPRDPEQAPTFAGLPSRFDKSKPLGEAPLPALVKQTRMGLLPVTAPDGRQSWQAYARPFSGSADKPKVGAVVTDLGLNKDATEAAIARLPPDVTLAFSPYAGGLDKWFKKARDAGHEVMLQLPSEPMSFPAQDPGPLALLTTLSTDENGQRLETVLSRAAGYVGVIGTGGRLAVSDQMAPVLQALKERGLLYVGDGADRDGAPPSTPGLVADQEPFRDAIDMRLGQVAAQARRGGGALAVVSARPVSLDRLAAFMSSLSDQGLQSAPASAIVKPKAAKQ